MPSCMIFITNPTSGSGNGLINLQGYAQVETQTITEGWTCLVGWADNPTTMHAKIKACVVSHYQTNWGITISGSDKVNFSGGIS